MSPSNISASVRFVLVLISVSTLCEGALRRCFSCRSRGELGSCKDPFTLNVTRVEHEHGVEAIPCASSWCGKIVERENALKEDYGIATQRLCLQRGPPDNEDRCAFTTYGYKKVYMCYCQGDMCNHANNNRISTLIYIIPLVIALLL